MIYKRGFFDTKEAVRARTFSSWVTVANQFLDSNVKIYVNELGLQPEDEQRIYGIIGHSIESPQTSEESFRHLTDWYGINGENLRMIKDDVQKIQQMKNMKKVN